MKIQETAAILARAPASGRDRLTLRRRFGNESLPGAAKPAEARGWIGQCPAVAVTTLLPLLAAVAMIGVASGFLSTVALRRKSRRRASVFVVRIPVRCGGGRDLRRPASRRSGADNRLRAPRPTRAAQRARIHGSEICGVITTLEVSEIRTPFAWVNTSPGAVADSARVPISQRTRVGSKRCVERRARSGSTIRRLTWQLLPPWQGRWRPGGPTGRRVVAGPGGAWPPPAEDHRPVRGRRPADGRRRTRPDDLLERLHLQLRGAARRARRPRLPVLLAQRHRGAAQGLPPLGRPVRRAPARHVRLRHRRA